jgi:hypothetical protein
MPTVAYFICAVEFAERASFYGIKQLIGNYVNRPMPKGGNGYGAPPKGTQLTGGALGLGTVKANAVSQSFSMLVYIPSSSVGWPIRRLVASSKSAGASPFLVLRTSLYLQQQPSRCWRMEAQRYPSLLGFISLRSVLVRMKSGGSQLTTNDGQRCSSQMYPSCFSIRWRQRCRRWLRPKQAKG